MRTVVVLRVVDPTQVSISCRGNTAPGHRVQPAVTRYRLAGRDRTGVRYVADGFFTRQLSGLEFYHLGDSVSARRPSSPSCC
jgi:hypothetical protein